MTFTRRNWIQGTLAIFGTAFCCPRAEGQVDGKILCSGIVSDPQDRGMPGLIVQMVEPNGRVSSERTDEKGGYRLEAPRKGIYVIVFREPQGKTHVHDVRQLTAGVNQQLNVTIDGAIKSFATAYSALQAIETLSAFCITLSQPDMVKVARDVEIGDKAVDNIMSLLVNVDIPSRQREFLKSKESGVRMLLKQLQPVI